MANVSISGTFRIIDRATAPMQRMEAQAVKTMAAIEALGAALDKHGPGDKHAQDADKVTRAFRDVDRGAKLAGRGIGDYERNTRKAKGESHGFVAAMQKIRDVAGGLMGVIMGLKFGIIAAGIGVAIQALGALGGGIVALMPLIADLAGAMAAVPSAAGAMAQGVLATVAAFSGVTGAIGAGFKEASGGAGGGGASMANQAEQNAHQLKMAYQQEADAQKALTDARREAKRELVDLTYASREAVLGQQGAALALQQARQDLEQTQMSGASDLSVQQAELAVRQAELGVDEAGTKRKRADADRRREFKKGVEQSDRVIQAQRALEQASWAVKQALEAASGSGAGGGGASAFSQAMKNLSPEAQAFVKQVIAMRPAIMRLRAAAGKELFPELGKGLTALTKMFPVLRANFQATGGVIGRSLRGIAEDATTPKRLSDTNKIMRSQTRILGMVGGGFRNIISALTDLMVAARPFTEWIFKTVEGWTETWKASAKAGRETGRIAAYLNRTKSSMQLFGRILHNLWDVFKGLGKAARPLGDRLWEGADKATKGWADFLKSAEGAGKARKYFDSLYKPLHALGRLAKTIAVEVFGISTNTGTLTQTADALTRAVPPVADLLNNASGLGPSIAEGLGAVAKLLNALPFSPIITVIQGLTKIMEAITWLIKTIPGLGMVISTLLLVSLGSKLLGAIGRVKLLQGAFQGLTKRILETALAQKILNGLGLGGLGGGGKGKNSPGIPRPGQGTPPVAPLGKFAGRAGAGLAIGLGGGLVSQLAGDAIGGDTGKKVSTIGSSAAMGAGIGALGGPWGALGGAIAGGVYGAIKSGLFSSNHEADYKKAGADAGRAWLKGLGTAGIDPKTGMPYPKGQSPYTQLQGEITGRKTLINRRQGELNRAYAQAQPRVVATGRGGTRVMPASAKSLKDLDKARAAMIQAQNQSVSAFVRGIKTPMKGRFLDTIRPIVSDFGKQFRNLNPTAQRAGAASMIRWVRGLERSGRAAKGSTRNLMASLVHQFGSLKNRWGRTGKEALANFDREVKKTRTTQSVVRLMNRIASSSKKGWAGLKDAPIATTKNWETVLKGRLAFLRSKISQASLPKAQREQARSQLASLERQAARARRAIQRSLDAKPKQSKKSTALRNIFGIDPTKPLSAPKLSFPKPKGDNAVKKSLDGIKTANDNARKGIDKLPGAVATAKSKVNTHAKRMADAYVTQAGRMVTRTNAILRPLGEAPIVIGAQAQGGRLPGYASGGRIPGAIRGDHVPLVSSRGKVLGIADGGELVVNRHTERRVNTILNAHGTSLGKEVAGESRPHWKGPVSAAHPAQPVAPKYAKGGRVRAPVLSGGGSEPIIGHQRRAANSLLRRDEKGLNKKLAKFDPIFKMIDRMNEIAAKNFPYKYGGGHGSFSGPYDCSGLVSDILHAGGFISSPMTTDGLKTWGKDGDGKYITVGVRGSTGRQAHTMMKLGNRYLESGSGHGAKWVGGWAGRGFPIHRHPAGYELGGKIDGEPGGQKKGQRVRAIEPEKLHEQLGWGLAKGGRVNWGGWHARGTDTVIRKPTLFGAGEAGPERVKIQPVKAATAGKTTGKAGVGNIEVHIGSVNYSAKGDIAKAIREEMELLGDELAMMGDVSDE